MASNLIKWSAFDTHIHCITGAALQNQANTALVLGDEVDNSAGYQYGFFQFIVEPAGTDDWHAGDYAAFWFIKAIDGSTYETSSTSVYPGRPPDFIIPFAVALGGAHVVNNIQVGPITLPAGKFRALCANKASHNFKDDTGNSLDLYRVSDDLITA
jgi:hypothetical protein